MGIYDAFSCFACQGPMKYLKEFKNPCWVTSLSSAYPYDNVQLINNQEYYPGFRAESAGRDFEEMRILYSNRLAHGESWRMRCAPYLYIVGVTKSGTTDLFANLIEHPDIVPGTYKEPMYWNWKVANRLPGRAATG